MTASVAPTVRAALRRGLPIDVRRIALDCGCTSEEVRRVVAQLAEPEPSPEIEPAEFEPAELPLDAAESDLDYMRGACERLQFATRALLLEACDLREDNEKLRAELAAILRSVRHHSGRVGRLLAKPVPVRRLGEGE